MSRGPGRLQRHALAVIDAEGSVSVLGVALVDAHQRECGCGELTCTHWESRMGSPSRAQLESARRALRSLAACGLVELRTTTQSVPVRCRVPSAERIYADDRQVIWQDRSHLVAVAPNRCATRESSGRTTLSPSGADCGRTIEQRMLGVRETDRCDSCARRFTAAPSTPTYGGKPTESGAWLVRGLALCFDCHHGLTDAIGLVSGGEYAINRMDPLPCGECGGELSPAGLRRIYINGATLPLCDTCYRRRSDAKLAKLVGDLA